MRFPVYPPIPLSMRGSMDRVPFEDDRAFVAEKFGGVPLGYFEPMLQRYLEKQQVEGRRAANRFCFTVAEMFPPRGMGLLADDADLIRHAEACARQVRQMLGAIAATSESSLIARLQGMAKRHGVPLPKVRTLAAVVQRMTREHWWRRQLRRRLCELEHGAIQAGMVHKRAGAYVSHEAFRRFQLQQRRLAQTLEQTLAVNQTSGEVCVLSDLIQKSVSNPRVRRAEMMTRLRGMERYATADGWMGVFYTITCPSRMHARLSRSGQVNPKYEGGAPSEAQRYLVKLWAKARTALDRQGVSYFGMRVTEPHHDATPHWHMLVFVHPDQEPQLTATLRGYAFAMDASEPGATEHRFKVERIDPAKGGAVAYVAKYVSKNIDGANMDVDDETGAPAARAAQRVEAWARLWRIRQFQFFGTPSVVPWRELRRLHVLPEGTDADWSALWSAADAGEWCDYTRLIRAGAMRLAPVLEPRESASYPGELVERVRGVRLSQAGRELLLQTRHDEWVIRWGERPEAVQNWGPWTRVNNCTGTPHQGLTSKRKTDFSVLSRKLRAGPDFSLAILDGNLDALEAMKVTEAREEARRELERAISEVVNEVRTTAHVQRGLKHRAEHPSHSSSRCHDRPKPDAPGLVAALQEEARYPGTPGAVLPAQRGGPDGGPRGGASGGPPVSGEGGSAGLRNRRLPGPPRPDKRLAMGLDEDGCAEG